MSWKKFLFVPSLCSLRIKASYERSLHSINSFDFLNFFHCEHSLQEVIMFYAFYSLFNTLISKREKKDRNKTEMKAKYREAAKCVPFGIERVDAQRFFKCNNSDRRQRYP
jgi:hypothetical protein